MQIFTLRKNLKDQGQSTRHKASGIRARPQGVRPGPKFHNTHPCRSLDLRLDLNCEFVSEIYDLLIFQYCNGLAGIMPFDGR
jgi:hypothetical protein